MIARSSTRSPARAVGLAQVTTLRVDGARASAPAARGSSQVRAVTPGYPFYGEITTAPGAAVERGCNRPARARRSHRCSSRSTRTSATRSRSASRSSSSPAARERAGRLAASRRRSGRASTSPSGTSGETRTAAASAAAPSTRRVVKLPRDASAAALFSARIRPACSTGGGRPLRTPAQTNRSHRVDRPAARLPRRRRPRRAAARRHRRRERRARVRHAEDRHRRGAALPGRDEPAGARDLPAAGGGDGAHRRGGRRALGVGISSLFPRVLTDFLPVDVKVQLEPTAIGLGLAVGVWVALVFALRPLVALRNVSPLQALRRETRRRGACAARAVDPVRILVALGDRRSASWASALRAPTTRARPGVLRGHRAAQSRCSSSRATAAQRRTARRVVRPTLAVRAAPGHREPLPARQPDARRRARARLRRLPHEHAVPGAGQPAPHARREARRSRAPTSCSSTCRRIRTRRSTRSFGRRATRSCSARRSCRCGSPRSTGVTTATAWPPTRRPVAAVAPGWALRREYRSTYRDTLVASEKVTAGRLPHGRHAARRHPRGLDRQGRRRGHARSSLGDTVTWNVQGVKVPTRVTSIREVNWARFEPNFFVVFERRRCGRAEAVRAARRRARHRPRCARLQRDVVRQVPERLEPRSDADPADGGRVLDKVTVAIRFLAVISLALGIPVLFSAVSATRRERLREGVLLKMLGATRRQIGRIMLAEYLAARCARQSRRDRARVGGAWALMRFRSSSHSNPRCSPRWSSRC